MYEQQSTIRTNTDDIFVQPYQLGFILFLSLYMTFSLFNILGFFKKFNFSFFDARKNEYRMGGLKMSNTEFFLFVFKIAECLR